MMFCENCGRSIDEGDIFCIKCGSKVSGVVQQNNNVDENIYVNNNRMNLFDKLCNKYSKKYVYIGIAGVVLLILFLGAKLEKEDKLEKYIKNGEYSEAYNISKDSTNSKKKVNSYMFDKIEYLKNQFMTEKISYEEFEKDIRSMNGYNESVTEKAEDAFYDMQDVNYGRENYTCGLENMKNMYYDYAIACFKEVVEYDEKYYESAQSYLKECESLKEYQDKQLSEERERKDAQFKKDVEEFWNQDE